MPGYNYSSVTDLAWADLDHSRLNCLVTFTDHPILRGAHPFTATESDPGWEHSEEIFARALNGDFGPIAEFEPPLEAAPGWVTPAQAKIVLFEAGLLDDVEALVAAHPYRPVRIWWANAIQFDRSNPYLQALGVELGLTEEQMDQMFISASKK